MRSVEDMEPLDSEDTEDCENIPYGRPGPMRDPLITYLLLNELKVYNDPFRLQSRMRKLPGNLSLRDLENFVSLLTPRQWRRFHGIAD